MKRLLYGVGINDSNYIVRKMINGKEVRCQFYKTWCGMIRRCYSIKFQESSPTYKGCEVCDDWLLFSNFKSWMVNQSWVGMQLDKDLLKIGNKIYSPDTCLFVPASINSLLESCDSSRGDYPIGVSFDKRRNKYRAQISIKGRNVRLGSFSDPASAHRSWQIAKAKVIENVAIEQSDIRIKNSLMVRVNKLHDDIENFRETIKI